jgi:malonyl-CoA/methylmalonyl-CoA synthetase
LLAGGSLIMLNKFDAGTVIDVLEEKNSNLACTMFMAVPAMYMKLLAEISETRHHYEHIRLWASGSAPLLPSMFHEIAAVLGKEPVEREGMTETGMNFSNPLHGRRKPGSIGVPLPSLKVRIVDPETKNTVNIGETGEIWLKGGSISPGYWRKEKETKAAFFDGWFRTGDLGYMDEDGYYFLTDRIKNIIISGGENISPLEVEKVINQFKGVKESAVVGLPDAKWGEIVVASVVPKPGCRVQEMEIKKFCKQHLHDWKCPKEILFLEKLPRNTMGKVLKGELKKKFFIEQSSGKRP